MKRKLFGFGIMMLSLFSTTFAAVGDFTPYRSGINHVSNPFGTGSSIEFNRLTDNTFIGQLRGHIPRTSAATGCPSPIQVECLRQYAIDNNLTQHTDERDFVVAKRSGTSLYDHTLSGLDRGDEIRVFVYVHDNALQGVSANAAQNVSVSLDWSNSNSVSATISSSNATPRAISDIVTLGLPANLTLEPVGTILHANETMEFFGYGTGSLSPTNKTDTSITVSPGTVQSCYTHAHGIYFDFRIIDAPVPRLGIDKIDANSADLDGNVGDDTQTIIEGSTAVFEITVTNNGGEALQNVVITDEESPSCSRTAAETKVLYGGGNFEIGASFTYSCRIENVTSATFVDGYNDIDVDGIGVDSGTNVNDEDPTEVIINPGVASISVAKVDNNAEVDQDSTTGADQSNIEYDNETKTAFGSEDSQTIYGDETSRFRILVVNDGNISLTNVVLTDDNAPDCNRNASETRALYDGDTFDSGESFSYECEKSNIQEDYVNQINVSANDGENTLGSSDRTEVIINPVRPGSFCGDGTLDTPNSNGENEECDDGNDVDDDSCSNICQENDSYCGDGTLDTPNSNGENEECDDGNNIDDDSCSNTCQINTQVCGNGIVEGSEACDDGNQIDTDQCTNSCTITGGGGGGLSSVPTIGTCVNHSVTGALQCVSRKPYEFGPQWTEYQQCVSNTLGGFVVEATTPGLTRAQKCAYAWAQSQGFQTCGDSLAGGIDYFSNNENNVAMCNPLPPLEPGVTPNRCPECFGGAAFIEKTVDRSHIARGDTVNYNLRLSFGLYDISQYEIGDITVKFYDFTIPSEGGNLWGRHGISNGWSLSNGGQRFQQYYGSTSGLVQDLNSAGGVEVNMSYAMNSALASTTDSASIDNVAFAVADYTYRRIGCSSDPVASNYDANCGILLPKKVLIPGEGQDPTQALTIWQSQNPNGSFSSLGDTATVKIIRPFVQSNNGGDLGFELSSGRTDKVTATNDDYTDGVIFVETDDGVDDELFDFDGYTAIDNIDPLKNFQTEAIDKYYDNLRFNTLLVEELGGNSFEKTPIQEVYFFDGATLSIDGTIDLEGKNKTFIIEEGDLVISKNGVKLENGFAAFIVRNGNIIIHEDVESMEGIFIAEKGSVKSNAISKIQLKVSGALMGDIAPLLNDRWFIGENPDIELEPNIEMEFDLRLLENTPPALEQFLGSDWGESIE